MERRIKKEECMENRWDKLPGDAQLMVLKRLSPMDLRRLQLSCKYFGSNLLSNLEFVIDYDQRNRPSDHQVVSVLGSFCDRRLLQGVPDVIPHLYFWEEGKHGMGICNNHFCKLQGLSWRLTTYGDGFLCFQMYKKEFYRGDRTFLVFNPLFSGEGQSLTFSLPVTDRSTLSPPVTDRDGTQPDYWTLSPPVTDRDGPHSAEISGIVFDRKKGVCKLVLCGYFDPFVCNVTRMTTSIYNCKEKRWTKIREFNELTTKVKIGFPLNANALSVNGRFLCWLMDGAPFLDVPDMVLVFDSEEEAWWEPIILGDELFDPLCLAEHENELCIISLTKQKKLQLWKFDMQKRMLRSLAKYMISSPPFPIPIPCYLNGGRGVVHLICSHRCNGVLVKECLWVYDMSRHSWKNLGTFSATPADREEDGNGGEIEGGIGTFFEPTLFRITHTSH